MCGLCVVGPRPALPSRLCANEGAFEAGGTRSPLAQRLVLLCPGPLLPGAAAGTSQAEHPTLHSHQLPSREFACCAPVRNRRLEWASLLPAEGLDVTPAPVPVSLCPRVPGSRRLPGARGLQSALRRARSLVGGGRAVLGEGEAPSAPGGRDAAPRPPACPASRPGGGAMSGSLPLGWAGLPPTASLGGPPRGGG